MAIALVSEPEYEELKRLRKAAEGQRWRWRPEDEPTELARLRREVASPIPPPGDRT
jgi:hypothetical protein